MSSPFATAVAPAREFTAECLGTFALTFIGGAAIMQTRNVDAAAGLLEVALAHGLALAVMVSALAAISAHFNPAVTLALLVTRHVSPATAVKCIGGQFAGAVIAAWSLQALFPAQLWEASRGTRPLVALDVSTGQAFALEAIMTGVVMLVMLGTVIDRKAPCTGGTAVGLAYAAGMLAIAPLTGGSMNPARSLGPMLVSRAYEGLALCLTAPVVGAVIAALVWTHLLPEDHDAPVTSVSSD